MSELGVFGLFLLALLVGVVLALFVPPLVEQVRVWTRRRPGRGFQFKMSPGTPVNPFYSDGLSIFCLLMALPEGATVGYSVDDPWAQKINREWVVLQQGVLNYSSAEFANYLYAKKGSRLGPFGLRTAYPLVVCND